MDGRTFMKTILLVEDEQDVLEVLSSNLARRGYSVATALNGEDAVMGKKLEKADLVITDVRMPRMGGFELFRQSLESHPHLPFIFISGHMVDLEEIKDLIQGRKVVLLNKPFNTEALVEAIQKVLP